MLHLHTHRVAYNNLITSSSSVLAPLHKHGQGAIPRLVPLFTCADITRRPKSRGVSHEKQRHARKEELSAKLATTDAPCARGRSALPPGVSSSSISPATPRSAMHEGNGEALNARTCHIHRMALHEVRRAMAGEASEGTRCTGSQAA